MMQFSENVEARDLYNRTHEEINAYQNMCNKRNVRVIETAYKEKRINDEEQEYFLRFFHDGMGCCRKVYRTIYEVFGQPENTCCFNPHTGEVDTDENGRIINYGLKVVTPFVNTRLDYQDKNNNPVYIFFPKMKSPERAIEKIEKEYGHERNLEMVAALDRFFETEDREAFGESLRNLSTTTSKLHDILRLTISAKYLSDVKRFARKLSENNSGFFFINPEETRDRFDMPLQENKKKYYDIKTIMHIKDDDGKIFDVEVQLKIDTLMQGDLRTHGYYEEVRQLQAELEHMQAQKNQKDELKIKETDARIKILNNRILQINQNAIHQYNMQVLDKARRIEDDGYRPLLTPPDYADGTYKRCREFINEEYMVESFNTFNGKTDFSADEQTNKLCFLRLIGKLPANFDEFSPNADKIINRRFDNLKEAEIERFNGINEVATRYQSIIRRKINFRKAQENPKPKQQSGKSSNGK